MARTQEITAIYQEIIEYHYLRLWWLESWCDVNRSLIGIFKDEDMILITPP
jgi:hypothetical protein